MHNMLKSRKLQRSHSPPEKYQIPPQGIIPPHLGTTALDGYPESMYWCSLTSRVGYCQ